MVIERSNNNLCRTDQRVYADDFKFDMWNNINADNYFSGRWQEMSKRSCAWLGADGKCKCEFIASKYKKRMMCDKLPHCKAYITNYALEKKLNKSAHDREITDDTRFLVKL